MVATVPVLALRWGWLLAAHAIHERVPWLTRTYFVAYTAGQVLPTSLGGDAVRVVETTRRHPGRATVVTGTVLLERGLGGAATVALGAIGFLLSIGAVRRERLPVARGRLRLRHARPRLPLLRALGASAAPPDAAAASRRFRLEQPSRHFYEGIHHYRGRPGLLGKVLAVTFAVQAVRILSIWAVGEGRRHRPRPAHLLRLRPAALPRHARAVHAERARGAGGVLRELPRERRRRREPGVRGRLPLLPRDVAARVPGRGDHAARRPSRAARVPRSSMAEPARVAVVVVTYDALPWIEQLPRLAARRRDRRRRQRVERRHGRVRARALSGRPRWSRPRTAGSAPAGTSASARRRATYVLLLNADAWLTEGALDRLVDFADTRPRAAVVGPRLAQPRRDATALGPRLPDRLAARDRVPLPPEARAADRRRSTPSTRAASTTTRCATVEVVMGACMLLRREAIEQVGDCDEDYFLFSEETDWCFRFREAGWRGRLLPRRRVRPRARRVAQRAALPREPPRPSALPLEAPRADAWPSARAACCSSRCGSAVSCSAASAAAPIATAPRGSPRATRRTLVGH